MKRTRCAKCGKVVYASEARGHEGELLDRVNSKEEQELVGSLGLGASYGGTYVYHKCK